MAVQNKHVLFHLGHPAHYHLFKNTIKHFLNKGIKVSVVIKKKDILETLLQNDGIEYENLLPEGRRDSKAGIFFGMIKTDYNLLKYCKESRPDIMVGTSYGISHVGKMLSVPSINVNEDDWDIVPFYSRFSYPWASVVLSPEVCRNGKWENKSIKYNGYHELAYLHPNHFKPDIKVASKYVDTSKKYFIVRFAKLKAHHDKGVAGISDESALKLIEVLKEYGNVYITSERTANRTLESYLIKPDPLDMHHLLAFAYLYIGDSQTMACEAGVLGTPFIRYNDFVGRIGYLNEMENTYKLGFGFNSNQHEHMFQKIEELLSHPDLNAEWIKRQQKMLNDKIDTQTFLNWFIENYPESESVIRKNPDFQFKFK